MNFGQTACGPRQYGVLLSKGASLTNKSLYALGDVKSINSTVDTKPSQDQGRFQIDVSVPWAPARVEAISAVANSVPLIVESPRIQNISTFVFLDLETTGLPRGSRAPKVQITEVSMIAVGKNDFERSQFSDLQDIRVVNKMCICVRPTVGVSPIAAKVTGLSDSNLHGHQAFDKDTAVMIQIFISKLPKPVCLLAHNGNVFDFPLLKAELEHAGVQLSSDILTADTLSAFKSTGNNLSTNSGSSVPRKRQKNGDKSERQSYALQNLYKRYFNKIAGRSHSAEGDCVALMMVCHKMRYSILPWISQNTRQFTSFKSMWR